MLYVKIEISWCFI